jgi:hypothetical protein
MAYSDSFQFGSDPTLKVTPNMGGTFGGWIGNNYSINPGQQNTGAANSFNSIMSGIDNTSNGYVSQLQDLYNQYGTNAAGYQANVQPIAQAIGTDITGMTNTNQAYQKTLDEIAPTMLNGIQVDPNASNTRNQYMGAVADQNKGAEQAMQQNSASQGQNPYANTGANREFALANGAGMANASNKAYNDWRTQYNTDMTNKGNLAASYAGLQSNLGAMENNVVNARGTQAGIYGGILGAQNTATGAQAQGAQDLLSYEQQQKQIQLQLAQQQQNNAQRANEIAANLQSKYGFGAGNGTNLYSNPSQGY